MKDPVMRVLDTHGNHAFWATVQRCEQWLGDGIAKRYGSKRKTHGVRLLIPLSQLDIEDRPVMRNLSPGSYGTRYTQRQRIAGQLVYSLKQTTGGCDPYTRVVRESLAVATC